MSSIYTKYLFELPIIPQVVSEVLKIPSNSNISSKEVEDILRMDPYLTTRVLKISNSSYYSREREIKSVKDAITLIGLNKIKALCLLIAGSEIINNKNSDFFKVFWSDSLTTAFFARDIACECGMSSVSEDIFTGGILHNIGQAILYNFSKDKYWDIYSKTQSDSTLYEMEKNEFGVDSRTVAAEVLNSWQFPKLHVEIVSNYLKPNHHSGFQSILDVVSTAKLLSKALANDNLKLIDNSLFLTYQSRLNLRKSQIDFYMDSFINKTRNNPYYLMCKEALYG